MSSLTRRSEALMFRSSCSTPVGSVVRPGMERGRMIPRMHGGRQTGLPRFWRLAVGLWRKGAIGGGRADRGGAESGRSGF